MRHLPYAVGLFMLLPFAIWFVLWAFVMPGPKPGLDVPLSAALFASSIPLVAWFYLSNLALLSNSMAGQSEFDAPKTRLVRWAIDSLPVAAVGFGVAGTVWLVTMGEPLYLTPLPLVMGVAIGIAIFFGERARGRDKMRRDALRPDGALRPAPEHALAANVVARSPRRDGIGHQALRLAYHLPFVGWLLRDAVEGRPSARFFFAANLAMLWVLALVAIGYPLMIATALLLCASVFVMLILICRA